VFGNSIVDQVETRRPTGDVTRFHQAFQPEACVECMNGAPAQLQERYQIKSYVPARQDETMLCALNKPAHRRQKLLR
jgi:hypothetical protein